MDHFETTTPAQVFLFHFIFIASIRDQFEVFPTLLRELIFKVQIFRYLELT